MGNRAFKKELFLVATTFGLMVLPSVAFVLFKTVLSVAFAIGLAFYGLKNIRKIADYFFNCGKLPSRNNLNTISVYEITNLGVE